MGLDFESHFDHHIQLCPSLIHTLNKIRLKQYFARDSIRLARSLQWHGAMGWRCNEMCGAEVSAQLADNGGLLLDGPAFCGLHVRAKVAAFRDSQRWSRFVADATGRAETRAAARAVARAMGATRLIYCHDQTGVDVWLDLGMTMGEVERTLLNRDGPPASSVDRLRIGTDHAFHEGDGTYFVDRLYRIRVEDPGECIPCE